MPIPITIPRLGWNMEEGVFGGWLKKDGDEVRAGEVVFTLESEKATEEIESLDSGTLHFASDSPKAGDPVIVGAVIGYLLQPGETPSNVSESAVNTAQMKVADNRSKPVIQSVRICERPAVSPRARRTARRLGIDWTEVEGSGRNGRIRECDILAAERPSSNSAATLRRIIAQRMSASHLTTAPVTLIATVDASALVQTRNRFKQSSNVPPTYSDMLIKLVSEALTQHPSLNARWENDRVVVVREINIGLAVDTPSGLVVPVLREVRRRSLKEIAQLSRDLIDRSNQRKLSADDMGGGSFTISNLGSFGIDAFTPIINQPECAILGVGRIQKQPVVVADQIAIREQMTLSLTFDHRIVDGAPAARFLRTLRGLIESANLSSEQDP